MHRRQFLASLAAAAVVPAARQQPAAIPIIDAHIHLFDPNRPQGAPYTGPKTAGPPVAALPARYRTLATPLGAVGAIKIEASPWIEDNLWVLEVAERDPMIVAVVGNLEPEKPEFAEYLDRYRKNRLFRGIRCGNLWGRDFTAQVGIAGVHRWPAASGRRRSRDGHSQSAVVAATRRRARDRQGPDIASGARSPAGAWSARRESRSRRHRLCFEASSPRGRRSS